jgi:hypothetical protein
MKKSKPLQEGIFRIFLYFFPMDKFEYEIEDNINNINVSPFSKQKQQTHFQPIYPSLS